MPELTHKGKTFVRLKDDTIFSLSDVPPASTKRWVASRKLNVVRVAFPSQLLIFSGQNVGVNGDGSIILHRC